MTTAALYFRSEAYTTKLQKLMGRNAAGESFLRGLLKYHKTDTFWAHLEKEEFVDVFQTAIKESGRTEPTKIIRNEDIAQLADVGVLHYPAPSLGRHAWRRSRFGNAAWSLCGITHTTSSSQIMDVLTEFFTAPLQPWDTLICTSNSVKSNVECIFQAQKEYLKQRMGACSIALPQMPVIPLGIHPEDFVFTDEQKKKARQAIGADDDTLVVLFVGRLSFNLKAHPYSMYRALEKAAERLAPGKKVMLVECGWYTSVHFERAYDEGRAFACKNVQVVSLDGREPDKRETAWACADVFCSLSDNIQETFGITPIEAMAAGIPVVVSDWDGYRESVRDGIDGFCVPTMMPDKGLGEDFARDYGLDVTVYGRYSGYTVCCVNVDVEATTEAFVKLFNSPDLRKKMGEAGKQRVQDHFTWKTIVPQYEQAWQKQNELRKAKGSKCKPLAHPWPARLDPFYAFAAYPTKVLRRKHTLHLVGENPKAVEKYVAECRKLKMFDFAESIFPKADEVSIILEAASRKRTVSQALEAIQEERRDHVLRAILWLAKIDAVRIEA